MRNRYLRVPAVLLVLLVLGACATLAPGEDPVVVNTQRTLTVSLAVWDTGLDWVRANPTQLSAAALAIAEKTRLMFPPAYKATDDALDLYKAGKLGVAELTAKLAVVQDLVSQIEAIVTAASGPPIRAQAVAKIGGK